GRALRLLCRCAALRFLLGSPPRGFIFSTAALRLFLTTVLRLGGSARRRGRDLELRRRGTEAGRRVIEGVAAERRLGRSPGRFCRAPRPCRPGLGLGPPRARPCLGAPLARRNRPPACRLDRRRPRSVVEGGTSSRE